MGEVIQFPKKPRVLRGYPSAAERQAMWDALDWPAQPPLPYAVALLDWLQAWPKGHVFRDERLIEETRAKIEGAAP